MYREPHTPAPLVVSALADHVVALALDDGREVWRAKVTGTPLRVAIVGERVLVLGNSLVALDYLSGERAWTARVSGTTFVATPTHVIVWLNGTATCVSAHDGAVLWTNRLRDLRGAASLAVPGLPSSEA